jgi:RimJ/RimL family protein N-acetyltransferase
VTNAPSIAITFVPVAGDAAAAVAAMLRDRPLRASLYGGRGNVSEAHAVSTWCGTDRGTLRLAVRCTVRGEIVGALRICDREVSYFVARPRWSSGYGQAMLCSLMSLPGEPPGEITLFARVARENVASRRALAAAGFKERGLEIRPQGLSPSIRYERIAPRLPRNI